MDYLGIKYQTIKNLNNVKPVYTYGSDKDNLNFKLMLKNISRFENGIEFPTDKRYQQYLIQVLEDTFEPYGGHTPLKISYDRGYTQLTGSWLAKIDKTYLIEAICDIADKGFYKYLSYKPCFANIAGY